MARVSDSKTQIRKTGSDKHGDSLFLWKPRDSDELAGHV